MANFGPLGGLKLNFGNIPQMFENLFTNPPDKVLYSQAYENKSFDEAMSDYTKFASDQYLTPEDISFYNLDEFALEKAAYQMQYDTPVGETPWGMPLSDIELQQVINEYPGIEAGFNINFDLETLEDADALYSTKSFIEASERVEKQAEEKGLLDSISDIFSRIGENAGNALIGTSPLEAQGLTDFGANIGAQIENIASNISEQVTPVLENIGTQNALNSLYGVAGQQQLFGEGVDPDLMNQINKLEDERLDGLDLNFASEMAEIYNAEGFPGLLNIFGNEANYGENGYLDMAVVQEWLSRDPLGLAELNRNEFGSIQDAVTAVENSIIDSMSGVDTTYSGMPDIQPLTPEQQTMYDDESFDEGQPAPMGTSPFEDTTGSGITRGGGAGSIMATMSGDGTGDGLGDGTGDGLEGDTGDGTTRGGGAGSTMITGEDTDPLNLQTINTQDLPRGLPQYFTRFLNEFNKRPGSGRFDYQARLPELFNEAEMLYYLQEPWENRSKKFINEDPLSFVDPNFSDKNIGLSAEDRIIEADHFSEWTNKFFDNPNERRGENFYSSVEDLRDNMSRLASLSEKDLGEDINRDLAYQQLMFMDPESDKAFNRVVRAVSAYNAPPDAEPWFKNQQLKYYTRLLRNWEAGGKTREDFLNRFVQERPY
tara:strand:- start:261 stop:2225 length:1965 start_codon:yes stop_codon:yes gene_type:complete